MILSVVTTVLVFTFILAAMVAGTGYCVYRLDTSIVGWQAFLWGWAALICMFVGFVLATVWLHERVSGLL